MTPFRLACTPLTAALAALGAFAGASSCLFAQGAGGQTIATSADIPTPHGTWRYVQLRDDAPWPCGFDNPDQCVRHRLRVENSSDDTLECTGRVEYDGANAEKASSATQRGVLMPKQSRTLMTDTAPPAVAVTAAKVDCTVRAPRQVRAVAPECRFKLTAADSLEEFYPPASKRLGEEGPVEVSFVLAQAEGWPNDVQVVGSSLSTRLDEAAVKYVKTLRFTTPCPGTRYEMRVRFALAG